MVFYSLIKIFTAESTTQAIRVFTLIQNIILWETRRDNLKQVYSGIETSIDLLQIENTSDFDIRFLVFCYVHSNVKLPHNKMLLGKQSLYARKH